MHLVADHSRISSACYAGLVPTAQIPHVMVLQKSLVVEFCK